MVTRALPPAVFFDSSEDFRRWLEANHDSASELWVGFHKKASGRGGVSYPAAVDEALCFGWIDGKTMSLGDSSYAIRFTPRRRGSNWSAVNVRRVAELTSARRMQPAGIRAFEARSEARTGVYSYENRPAELPDDLEQEFRRHPAAWEFFGRQSPAYRRNAAWWVVSAKRPETRDRRLRQLIESSADGRRPGPLNPP